MLTLSGLQTPDRDSLRQHIVYRCIVGSRAFGLAGPNSDEDRRGVYLPPADLHWGLTGVPEQIEWPETEECYWELGKFVRLALRANPNILECLHTPLIEHATPLGEELLSIRRCFVSRLVCDTYQGYAEAQFRKLLRRATEGRPIRWKHAMHLIRLLLAGLSALRTGEILIDVGEHREALLRVARGEMTWDEIADWRGRLLAEYGPALAETCLPAGPDVARANEFLLKARRSAV